MTRISSEEVAWRAAAAVGGFTQPFQMFSLPYFMVGRQGRHQSSVSHEMSDLSSGRQEQIITRAFLAQGRFPAGRLSLVVKSDSRIELEVTPFGIFGFLLHFLASPPSGLRMYKATTNHKRKNDAFSKPIVEERGFLRWRGAVL